MVFKYRKGHCSIIKGLKGYILMKERNDAFTFGKRGKENKSEKSSLHKIVNMTYPRLIGGLILHGNIKRSYKL